MLGWLLWLVVVVGWCGWRGWLVGCFDRATQLYSAIQLTSVVSADHTTARSKHLRSSRFVFVFGVAGFGKSI